MRSHTVSTALLSAALILLLPALVAAADAGDAGNFAEHPHDPHAHKLDPDLLARLSAEETGVTALASLQRIVVSLEDSESFAELRATMGDRQAETTRRSRISRQQQAALAAVTEGRLQLMHLYQSLYGFSALADAAAIRALIGHPGVRQVSLMPVHVKMDTQAHALTNTDIAHTSGFLGQAVTIAIIDDGIDHDHPAFGGSTTFPNAKILGGFDFADNDGDPRVDCAAQSHGTSVTGVAAGDGGGVTGVAPDASVVFLKIQSAALCGQPSLDGDLTGAIDWAVSNRDVYGIKVISMSLGTSAIFGSPCSGIAESGALQAAAAAGMITLAASGNGGASSGISSPACHPAVASVGAVYDANIGSANFGFCNDATTSADRITCYSNSNTFLDLLAPSHCALTATTGGGTTTCFGGTSSSTPYAAGVAALLFGKDPALAGAGALTAMRDNGVAIFDQRNGASTTRVDAWAALEALDGAGGQPCADCIDFSITTTVPYSSQDNVGSVEVQDEGATLALFGNRWRRTTETFEITPNTVLEFEFMSTAEGEIHGIGFDEDDWFLNDLRLFRFFGTHAWGGAIANGEAYTSADLGTFRSFRIRVGDFYTGTGMRLVFVNDKDSGAPNNDGFFRNVRVFEDDGGGNPCSVNNNFDSSAVGWSNSSASTCSTGAFVRATPTFVSNSGVTTQVGGDHTSGSGAAMFTATNSSAGVNDVDGGNCVLDSPTWAVNDDSTLSVWYFHGQRDTADDPGDDFFLLEVSTDGGGSYSPMVSIGDERTQAAWQQASAQIPAGADVRLRVQVADGAGPGDLVEGGIDDLMICPN